MTRLKYNCAFCGLPCTGKLRVEGARACLGCANSTDTERKSLQDLQMRRHNLRLDEQKAGVRGE